MLPRYHRILLVVYEQGRTCDMLHKIGVWKPISNEQACNPPKHILDQRLQILKGRDEDQAGWLLLQGMTRVGREIDGRSRPYRSPHEDNIFSFHKRLSLSILFRLPFSLVEVF